MGRFQAAFAHDHDVVGDEGSQPGGVGKIDLEGLQIAIVHTDNARFERQHPKPDQGDGALAAHLNGFARYWATHPAAEVRDGPKAIANATKACKLSNWQNPEHVDTLAAAFAEVGDFASAVEWQKKAIDLLTEEPRPRSDFESRLKPLLLSQ